MALRTVYTESRVHRSRWGATGSRLRDLNFRFAAGSDKEARPFSHIHGKHTVRAGSLSQAYRG